MKPRDKVSIQPEKKILDRGQDPTASKYVKHGPGSGDLMDLSDDKGSSAPQSNDSTRGSETYMTSDSMKAFFSAQNAEMTSFLQYYGQQAEAQRSTLGHMTDHISGIVTGLGNTVSQWLRHSAARQEERLYEELNRAYMRVGHAESQCQQLKMDHQGLQKQLQEANTKLADAVKERNELRKLADIASWTGAAKISDDAIRSQWKQLDYNIRAMARAMAKCPTKCPTDDVNKARFGRIVSSWPKLLENDDYKELILAAYLWILVNEEIFVNGDKFWGGGFIGTFKTIRGRLVELAPRTDRPLRLGPTMRHVAKWSAQGTALLSHFDQRDKKAPKRHASKELDRLKLFCNITAEKSGTDFLQEMKVILETALNLDEMLMGSMAILSTHELEHGPKSLRYDADLMDVLAHTKELSPKTAVDFIISPMLLKTGNANGCNYDSEMVLCKASVVCK